MPDIPALPAIADQPLSVVLLADGSAPLDAMLPGWTSYLDRLGRPWEILLTETRPGALGSTLDRYLRNPKITAILRDGEPGEGLALRAGLDRAEHPLVYTAPLAPGYPPTELNEFLVKPRAHRPDTNAPCPEIDLVHLATGYRVMQPVPSFWRGLGTAARMVQQLLLSIRPTPLPGWLGFRAHLAGLLYRMLFGIRNRDAFCPCRLLRREIIPRLALQSQGRFVHVEILAKATFLGLILSEDIPLSAGKKSDEQPNEPVTSDFWRIVRQARFGPPERSNQNVA